MGHGLDELDYGPDELVPMGAKGNRDYLYVHEADDEVFVRIMMEMNQLNEYCAVCRDATLMRWGESSDKLERYQSERSQTVEHERMGHLDIWIFEAKFEYEIWKDNLSFITPATCLVLLAIFLEKSLKSIGIAYSPNGRKAPRAKPGMSAVKSYMSYLRKNCGFAFEQPAAVESLLQTCRKVRNAFAHGDWDDVKAEIGDINLPEAFAAVTRLIENIEAGQPRRAAFEP
jgi:hypothetical protein